MRYLVFATDYDGTLAKDGKVSRETIEALQRLKASGRTLLLITGRVLEDVQQVFPQFALFDYIVAENGALLYQPAQSAEKLLGKRPDEQFLQALRERGVPFGTGKIIVATSRPYEQQVLEVIQEQGLDLQIILNKGAVMILPTGVNKGSGLLGVLQDLRLAPQNVVGVGDAENDMDFLSLCGYAVAVANALPALKESADYTTQGERGEGIIEVIEQLLRDDLAEIGSRSRQRSKRD